MMGVVTATTGMALAVVGIVATIAATGDVTAANAGAPQHRPLPPLPHSRTGKRGAPCLPPPHPVALRRERLNRQASHARGRKGHR